MSSFEFESPEVMYAASRRIRPTSPFLSGRDGYGQVMVFLTKELRAIGLSTHEVGSRIIVTAGTADIDGPWRKAAEGSRAYYVKKHAEVAARYAVRDAERRESLAQADARRKLSGLDEETYRQQMLDRARATVRAFSRR